jgi:hypothetical protein
MMEGSGSRYVPLTNGSGRAKKLRKRIIVNLYAREKINLKIFKIGKLEFIAPNMNIEQIIAETSVRQNPSSNNEKIS